VRSATSSLDRLSASAVVSLTGNAARKGTPSARRMVSDLSLLSLASAEIPRFSADTLHSSRQSPCPFQAYNITSPLRQRQDRASQRVRPTTGPAATNQILFRGDLLRVTADELSSIVWDGTREISVEQRRFSGDRMSSFRCGA